MPVNIGDEIIRNVPEQVQKNMDDIVELENKTSDLQNQVNNCLKKASIVDNLDSTATNRPLSANMGKELNEKINAAMAGVYKPRGSLTVAQINALDTSELESGYVYNLLDSGTITLGSIHVNEGDNVVWIIEGGVGKWDPLAGTIDISDLASLSGNNTFAANNTFEGEVYIETGLTCDNIASYQSNQLSINGDDGVVIGTASPIHYNSVEFVGSIISPAAGYTTDLGSSTQPFKDLYLSGSINKNSNSFGVRPPDTSSYTADKVIATTDQAFNVINASDIVNNTLTQEQFDLIINHKPTRVIGDLNGRTDLVLFPSTLSSGSVWQYLGMYYYHISSDWYIGTYQLDSRTNKITFYENMIGAYGNNLKINNKIIPAYPANTGTFVLKCVDGFLTWVAE